jgi:hypothetical protein
MAGRTRTMTVAQRRARLALRHHLAPTARADSATRVAGDQVGLHATDPASVHLSVLARLRAGGVADVERELYDDRSLVRLIGMRRTMFVAPVDLAGVIQAASSRAIAVRQWRRYADLIAQGADLPPGTDVDAWLRDVAEGTMRALVVRGEATGAELSTDEPRLRTPVGVSEGKSYGGTTNITTWVLFLLAADGRIVRGRPRGSWLSSQYRWSAMETWLPAGLADWSTADAQVELARRWLASYGPGTVADLRWWTGWTAGETKKALGALAPVEVDLGDGGTGLMLPGDEAVTEPDPEPWAALLPSLDPTPMGWSQRGWYLGEHKAALFDRSGNIGPTIWWNGRVVGGWGQRRDASIAYRLLEDIGADGAAAVEAEAARAGKWFDGVVVTPRFRTPLERELSA